MEEWNADEEGEQLPLRVKCGTDDEDTEDKSECDSVDFDEDEEYASDDELQIFLQESTEFRAKVQYQVRVVALMPGFQAAGRKIAYFSTFYKQRFGKSLLEKTGFSSAEMICKSMPHVVRRELLDVKGEVALVESAKNMRIVAGIRSGLRRLVFDILTLHPKGLSAEDLDEECSRVMGRPLTMALTELLYDTPNVECLARDMPDIASRRQAYGVNKYFLSIEAEDPSLSDGIFIGLSRSFPATPPDALPVAIGAEDDVIQARFRVMVLLALHSDGVAIGSIQKIYKELYSENLDPWSLGYGSVQDLVASWEDIILVRGSKVFYRPSRNSSRLLRGLRTGLRMEVFSILLSTYPKGVEPSALLKQLESSHPDELLQVLDARGLSNEYFDDPESGGLHLLCFVVQDMIDFIRFGCRDDDGTLVLKLRETGFPVLDFPDCFSDDEFVKLLTEDKASTPKVLPKVNGYSAGFPDDSYISDNDMGGGEERAEEVVEHQIRLLLASGGVKLEELLTMYKERTEQEMTESQFKSFVSSRPGLVKISKGGVVELVQSPRNLRIIAATRAGLRQVLCWSLLKNAGGVWSGMLEGWFLDFTGFSLTKLLLKLGYEESRKRPLFAVSEFLEDMCDLCSARECGGIRFYVSCCCQKADPAVQDAKLLGASLEEVEYDPVKLCREMSSSSSSSRLESRDEQQSETSVEQHTNETSSADESSWEAAAAAAVYDPPKAYATPIAA